MLKAGLTGNIGSGKSAVATIFKTLGINVFHADLEARKLLEDQSVKAQIRQIFGEKVFSEEGMVNRPALAHLVFKNSKLLEALNNIIHPAVRVEYGKWCTKQNRHSYTLYEAAILFESGYYKEMDRIICVSAPEELRISRVMRRDGITEEEVKRRMENQWDEAKKISMADFVIKNDGSASLIEQVLAIHNKLIINL